MDPKKLTIGLLITTACVIAPTSCGNTDYGPIEPAPTYSEPEPSPTVPAPPIGEQLGGQARDLWEWSKEFLDDLRTGFQQTP